MKLENLVLVILNMFYYIFEGFFFAKLGGSK